MAKRKPKPTKAETFAEAVDLFASSDQTGTDYLKLMVAFRSATMPDAGLHFDVVERILNEKFGTSESSKNDEGEE